MNWADLRKRYDPNNYYDDLVNFPEHVVKALKQMESFSIDFKPSNIIVCGMGGSAIPGYLLKDYCYNKLSIPVEVVNGYDLPKWVDEHSLVFIISYSGNTEEALSCLKQSMSAGSKIVLISSGGLLERAAVKYGFLFIKAPSNFQPRAATPYLFIYLLEVLRKIGLIFPNYDKSLSNLRKVDIDGLKGLAEQLIDKFVYIYVPKYLESVGRRLQAQDFNENAKTLAKFSVIPEACHNEMSAWGECQDLPLSVLFLWDDGMSDVMRVRTSFVKSVISKKADVFMIKPVGDDLLSKMLTLIYQGDLISYYLSLLRGKNPLPVVLVEQLKKVLKDETNFKIKLINDLGLN